jgi:hypothetical protein
MTVSIVPRLARTSAEWDCGPLPTEVPMKRLLASLLCPLALAPLGAGADPGAYFSIYTTAEPGFAYGFAANVDRAGGSPLPLSDFTVAAQLSARNGPGVNQWAFGAATEAWATRGSRSILVGLEAAVINEEPTNLYPKIANNAVMKNRADNGADPGQPMNANSIAYWVSAQPGTGFERGLVFDTHSLVQPAGRPAAIDLSDIPDEVIGEIDLIRIRKDVSLRYDPATRQLVLHVAPAIGR